MYIYERCVLKCLAWAAATIPNVGIINISRTTNRLISLIHLVVVDKVRYGRPFFPSSTGSPESLCVASSPIIMIVNYPLALIGHPNS